MNKKAIAIVIAALVVIFILWKTMYKSLVPVSTNEPIKVGVLMPFTTAFGWWGDEIRHSIELTQKDGYLPNYSFFYQDTKCNTKDAVTGTQALKAQYPDMHIFIVGCDNDLKAMVPILDKTKDIAFIPGLSGADLYEQDFPIINIAYRLESEATAAAEFAVKKLGVKTSGIITDNGAFGTTLADTFSKYLASIGGSSVKEQIKFNDPNLNTSVSKITQNAPGVVYMQNDIPALSAILKRLNQIGYKGAKIVYYGGRDQSLIDTAGAAAEGVYVPWVMSDVSNPSRASFEAAFSKAYGKTPFVTAYFMRDGLVMLDQASKKCGADTRCVEEYFYDTKDFSGTTGRVQFQPNGEVKRNFYFQTIKGGKFVDVTN